MLKMLFEEMRKSRFHKEEYESATKALIKYGGKRLVEKAINSFFPVTLRSDYSPTVHKHIFPDGTSQEEKEQFIIKAQKSCKTVGLNLQFTPIVNGQDRVEFHFNTADEYEKFVRSVFGDADGNFALDLCFDEEDKHWMADARLAAENWLKSKGVRYEINASNDEMSFKFDNYLTYRYFEIFLEDGRFDKAMENIEQERLQHGLVLGIN